MKRISLFLTMCSILLLSCENKLEDGGIHISNNTEQTSSPYHITLEQALENMYSTMDALNLGTRAKCRVIKDVQRIPSARRQTRSGDALGAFYVVNFENDEGFAILAADTRISADVIGIGEQGNFTYIPLGQSETRSWPVDTLDTSANTLTLEDIYVPEEDDYLLGGGEDDGNNFLSRAIDILDSNIENPIDNGEGGGGTSYRYDTITTTSTVTPLLTTSWKQQTPFNNLCPRRYYFRAPFNLVNSIVRDYNYDTSTIPNYINSEPTASGCVAIAVMQIIAHNQYPSVNCLVGLSPEENPYTWADLTTADTIATQYENIAAQLSRTIGDGCNMIYGFWDLQSFALPINAKRYLETLGYTNVQRHKEYNFDTVKTMLDNGCPIFVSAISGVAKGHAWLIDGYQIITRTQQKKTSSGYVMQERTLSTDKMVHCNWGWGGSLNGHFTSGIFELDWDDENGDHHHRLYDAHYRVITYNKPNNQ